MQGELTFFFSSKALICFKQDLFGKIISVLFGIVNFIYAQTSVRKFMNTHWHPFLQSLPEEIIYLLRLRNTPAKTSKIIKLASGSFIYRVIPDRNNHYVYTMS